MESPNTEPETNPPSGCVGNLLALLIPTPLAFAAIAVHIPAAMKIFWWNKWSPFAILALLFLTSVTPAFGLKHVVRSQRNLILCFIVLVYAILVFVVLSNYRNVSPPDRPGDVFGTIIVNAKQRSDAASPEFRFDLSYSSHETSLDEVRVGDSLLTLPYVHPDPRILETLTKRKNNLTADEVNRLQALAPLIRERLRANGHGSLAPLVTDEPFFWIDLPFERYNIVEALYNDPRVRFGPLPDADRRALQFLGRRFIGQWNPILRVSLANPIKTDVVVLRVVLQVLSTKKITSPLLGSLRSTENPLLPNVKTLFYRVKPGYYTLDLARTLLKGASVLNLMIRLKPHPEENLEPVYFIGRIYVVTTKEKFTYDFSLFTFNSNVHSFKRLTP